MGSSDEGVDEHLSQQLLFAKIAYYALQDAVDAWLHAGTGVIEQIRQKNKMYRLRITHTKNSK